MKFVKDVQVWINESFETKKKGTNDFSGTKERRERCLEEDHLRRTMFALEFMTSTRACNRIETIMEFLHERRRKDGDVRARCSAIDLAEEEKNSIPWLQSKPDRFVPGISSNQFGSNSRPIIPGRVDEISPAFFFVDDP